MIKNWEDDEKYKDIELIGILFKIVRETRGLLRSEVGRWISDEEEVRSLEEGKEGDFWEIRQMAGRLHVPSAVLSAYLNPLDKILVDLELGIWHNLLFWQYEEAEKKLERFWELCNRKNAAMLLLYYRFYAQLLIRQNRREKEKIKELQDFVEKNMPDFEKCLQTRRALSPDELALIAAYDRLVEGEPQKRLKKLYSVVYYFREVYAKEEHWHPFYAGLMFACAQEQYALGDYMNCVEQCLEGIQVTEYFRSSIMGGELYELMADAEGEMLKRELAVEREKDTPVMGKKRGQWIQAILHNYESADKLYRYCWGYKDGHKKILERKVEQWKVMTEQNL